MSTSMTVSRLQRAREHVIGGTPSPWDSAMAWGVSVGAFLLAAIFARGRQLDDIPVAGLREELLLLLFSAGPALLVAFPLAMLLFALVSSARPRQDRMRAWLIAGVVLVLVSGFVAPLALRAAWSVDPDWYLAWEPLAWLVTEIPGAALSGTPPGARGGEPAGLQAAGIAGRCAGWTAALASWLACWPLMRRVQRVHVGWPAILSVGVLSVASMLARTFVTARQSDLGVVLAASVLASLLPCLIAWRFVAAGGARWAMPDEPAREASTRSPHAHQFGRVAALAVVAIIGWIAFLTVLSPRALRSVADAFRTRPRVGEMAPDFAVQTGGGGTIRLVDWRGKPVLVAFGASWCGPCRQEFPHLAEIDESGGDVAVLWISKDDDRAALDAFLAQQPKLPLVALANEAVLLDYDVEGIPSTYLIDAAGRVAWRQIGFGRGAETRITDAIAALRPAS